LLRRSAETSGSGENHGQLELPHARHQGAGAAQSGHELRLGFPRSAGVTFSRVLVSGNYIAMTFDDGPHPKNTPRLLDILRARNVKATFYVIGRSVDLYPQIVRRTVAEGHEIGNHTHTHRLLSKLGDSEVRMELSRCRDAVAAPPASGCAHAPALRRPAPAPARTRPFRIRLSHDPLVGRSARLEAPRPERGHLAHPQRHHRRLHRPRPRPSRPTVDAMPATIDGLLRRGFKFVTVSQLLAMKTDPPPPKRTRIRHSPETLQKP
jgi:peptidoglycan-N-acetylglucosamine deacetylase